MDGGPVFPVGAGPGDVLAQGSQGLAGLAHGFELLRTEPCQGIGPGRAVESDEQRRQSPQTTAKSRFAWRPSPSVDFPRMLSLRVFSIGMIVQRPPCKLCFDEHSGLKGLAEARLSSVPRPAALHQDSAPTGANSKILMREGRMNIVTGGLTTQTRPQLSNSFRWAVTRTLRYPRFSNNPGEKTMRDKRLCVTAIASAAACCPCRRPGRSQGEGGPRPGRRGLLARRADRRNAAGRGFPRSARPAPNR